MTAPDPVPSLRWRNVQALPLVHGRLAFALEVRRQMLNHRFDVIAVELPPSLQSAVLEGIEHLPEIRVVLYREQPEWLDQEGAHLWYVPIDPCDGIIEALRIARGERAQYRFIDAEVEDFSAQPLTLPDAHAMSTLGIDRWYAAVLPKIQLHPRSNQDEVRERHMAQRLADLSEEIGQERRILFLCGLAHWEGIRTHLEDGSGYLHEEAGPPPEQVQLEAVHPRSLVHLLGETAHTAWRYETHRSGIALEDYDPTWGLKDLLLEARASFEEAWPDSQEAPTTRALATTLDYVRKLTVRSGRLLPDTWTLATAAKGCVGNDFAVTLLDVASRYPPNGIIDLTGSQLEAEPEIGHEDDQEPETDYGSTTYEDSLEMTGDSAGIDDQPVKATPRTPGEATVLKPLELRPRPDFHHRSQWKKSFNPFNHCSWPKEDLVIENFRDYVSRRALALAGLALHRTEPFTSSFKDGLAMRETLRDWHRRRIHVKEEPTVAGDIGALVLIFDEDDDGTRFPWRTTWMAEHENESTLAFYSTNPEEDVIGPGIGRIFYGGCFFLFPPQPIPDVWDDLRFERARTPSERLLLAALHYSPERFVAFCAKSPPAPEVRAQAESLGKHIIYLPLTSFSAQTLEKLRRAHVLNGHEVRSWADRFIR